MLDLPHLLLLPSNTPVVFTILVSGYIFSKNPKMFLRAASILCFTIIFNAFLKSLWQIPLPISLNPFGWYAFPSGHTNATIVLFGWLAIEYRKPWLWPILILMFCGVGYGLVAAGYHDLDAVLAAAAFAIIQLIIFYYVYQQYPTYKAMIFSTLLFMVFCIANIHNINTHFDNNIRIVLFLWRTFGLSLAALILTYHQYLQEQTSKIDRAQTRTITTVLFSIVLVMIGTCNTQYLEYMSTISPWLTTPIGIALCFLLIETIDKKYTRLLPKHRETSIKSAPSFA